MRIRKATFSDWKLLLNWRNDTETRRCSHNPDIVQEEDHKKWLKTVLNNENRELYIAFEDEIPVGTIRADWDENSNSYELSWTVSPSYRKRGLCKKMVRKLVKKRSDKFRAEIHKMNVASRKVAEYVGLKLKYENNNVLHYTNY